MNKITIAAQNGSVEAIYLKAVKPTHAVIFATGGGGNPERHYPLLTSLVENGCTVIAPYFERIMPSPKPTVEVLETRVALLQSALDYIGQLNLPIVGIGHSIGSTLLLGLAGGQLWTYDASPVAIRLDSRIKKLILFTPATDFFQAPNTLDAVSISIQAWAGSLDKWTTAQQIENLKDRLPKDTVFDFRLSEGADHFSFMNTLPPNVIDSMENRDQFLRQLAADVVTFIKNR